MSRTFDERLRAFDVLSGFRPTNRSNCYNGDNGKRPDQPGNENRMKKELTAQVGADGVLTLALPLGQKVANNTVYIIVKTLEELTA